MSERMLVTLVLADFVFEPLLLIANHLVGMAHDLEQHRVKEQPPGDAAADDDQPAARERGE